jgi:hypothetical protein
MVKDNNNMPCISVIVQEHGRDDQSEREHFRSIHRLRQGYKAAEADPQHAFRSQAVARALADLEPCTHTGRARRRSVTSGRRQRVRDLLEHELACRCSCTGV